MTQPLDRSCQIKPQGEIDHEAGEFWVNNPFELPSRKHNLSAFERNRLFLNQNGTSFVDLSYESSADVDSDSRSAITGDFDGDGRTDLLVASVGGGPLRLFLNRVPTDNHRVRLKLTGIAKIVSDENSVSSNRSAIGARVTAKCGDQTIVRDLFPANGFMGQNANELILGVGQAEKIDRLTVRWSSGLEQSFEDVPVDVTLALEEKQEMFEIEE